MLAVKTRLAGPVLVEHVVHQDSRGFFQETYRRDAFRSLGITDEFVQDNHSRSVRGVVRGMHFQPGMAKMIRCVRGEIFDVLVDIRPGSATFGEWEGFTLSDSNHFQLYCPDRFAHGFVVMSEVADVVYRCSMYYDPSAEAGFAYNDPAVGISWPPGLALEPSARDAAAPALAEIAGSLRSG